MLTFDERLAAAKAAKETAPESRDVEIILDAGLGKKVDDLTEELTATRAEEAADNRLAQSFERTAAVQAKLDAARAEAAEMVVTLRFVELPAAQWVDVKAACPVRLDSDIDRHYGFNADKAGVLASPLCGARVDGDELVELTDQQWRDLFATIRGAELSRIADAHFDLNEYGPTRRLEDAKKVSATRHG